MRRLGNYDVHDRIGEGGMGVVYKATDRRCATDVALKLLHSKYEADEARRARFLREGEYTRLVEHAGVVKVLELGEVHLEAGHRTLFLCMELIPGQELSQLISHDTPPQRWVAEIGLKVAQALRAIAAEGLVHRDIKPGNVLVTSAGAVKLLDFGLAVRVQDAAEGQRPDGSPIAAATNAVPPDPGLTQFGSVVGTPGYAAPEQLRGEPLDARADLYALGASLYQMLTGALPFTGATPREVLAAMEKAMPESLVGTAHGESPSSSVIVSKLVTAVPGISVRLAQLVGALMSVSSAQRPQRAEHVETALEAILADDPDLDRPLDAPAREPAGATSAWMRLKDWLDA